MGLVFASWWEDLVFLVASLVALGLLKARGAAKSLEAANIKSVPLLTSLWLGLKVVSFRISASTFFDAIYNHFPDEKAVGYVAFFRPVLMVRDPGMVEKVLVKDFGFFHDHGPQLDTEINPLEGNLFNMTGGKWRALRARLSPVFSSGKLKNMFPQVDAVGDRLISALPRGQDFLIRDYLSRFAIDVIASTAFGLEAGALEDPNCEFRQMATRIFKPRKSQIAKMLFRTFFPEMFKKLRLKSVDDEVNNFFFSVTKQAFEHRAAAGASRGDFVDLLLQLKGKGRIEIEGGEKSKDFKEEIDEASQLIMTDELLTAQSSIFLAAGWETSTTAMVYTLYFLAKNQGMQSRLREEIRSYDSFDYDSIKAMAYLDSCISEAMRLYPPGLILLRVCTKDYLMVDEESGTPLGRIEKEFPVLIPVHSMQRDPRNYPDPEVFDPERFMKEDKAMRRPCTYMPFGEGPRICIAQRFALMEVRVAVAKLVSKFSITLSSKTKEPISIDPKNFVNDIAGGLWVSLEEIEESS